MKRRRSRCRKLVACWIPWAGRLFCRRSSRCSGCCLPPRASAIASRLTQHYLAVDSRFIAVAVYTLGMALLTMVMGNAFAAFPIVTAGVGIPILVLQHGGNPAVMAAIGMFSGYCGTLMTPMAANFNIVPAALLELPDKNTVIKAQVPTGVMLLIVNVFCSIS